MDYPLNIGPFILSQLTDWVIEPRFTLMQQLLESPGRYKWTVSCVQCPGKDHFRCHFVSLGHSLNRLSNDANTNTAMFVRNISTDNMLSHCTASIGAVTPICRHWSLCKRVVWLLIPTSGASRPGYGLTLLQPDLQTMQYMLPDMWKSTLWNMPCVRNWSWRKVM